MKHHIRVASTRENPLHSTDFRCIKEGTSRSHDAISSPTNHISPLTQLIHAHPLVSLFRNQKSTLTNKQTIKIK